MRSQNFLEVKWFDVFFSLRNIKSQTFIRNLGEEGCLPFNGRLTQPKMTAKICCLLNYKKQDGLRMEGLVESSEGRQHLHFSLDSNRANTLCIHHLSKPKPSHLPKNKKSAKI